MNKRCHVDWSKGRQNCQCVHSSKAVHHPVSHLDVFPCESTCFILALKTNHYLCLYGRGTFSLYIFYRPFFFLISCSALPKSTVFLAFPRLSACVFFPLLLKCQWKHRKSKPVSLIGITDDLVYQIGGQCCCLPKLRWTVHFICKETYLIVELYC